MYVHKKFHKKHVLHAFIFKDRFTTYGFYQGTDSSKQITKFQELKNRNNYIFNFTYTVILYILFITVTRSIVCIIVKHKQ